ncbi:Paired box protein Pax-2-A [Dictyocoela muelleri]|nr:Paired box protein Pax-2-A [Dictyocoela muelleri]
MRKNETSLEKRKLLIKFYDDGIKVSEIARRLDINKSTVSRIIKRFVETGEISALVKGGNRRQKLTDIHNDAIREYLNENETLSLKEIQNKIKNQFNIRVDKSKINRSISNFYYSLKRLTLVPIRRNIQVNIDKRYEYVQRFLNIISENDGNNLIFIDEVGFQLSMRRGRERSQVGSRAVCPVAQIRTRNLNICAAMMKSGVLHHKIELSDFNT